MMKEEAISYMLATNRVSIDSKEHHFKEDLYRSKLKDIGIYLSMMRR